jgi:hypothetical protein
MDQPRQLDFLEFIDQLGEGEFSEFPIDAEDIGGELLAILSKGLYTVTVRSLVRAVNRRLGF